MIRRPILPALLLLTGSLVAQTPRGTLVMAVRQEPVAPVPYIGPSTAGNADVADQLFLRLATLGSGARTTGDDALVPELAQRWIRRDARTVDFLLDPRARWHDGVPVSAADVTFAWDLIRTPVLGVDQAPYELIDSVLALDARTVRVRFRRPSAEQVYTAGFLLQPLPRHLIGTLPADSLGSSAFARGPVGNGPFRFVRRVPGSSVELRAVPDFFLGTPGLRRLVFRLIGSTDAQVNALLAGETDVMAEVPVTALDRVTARRDLRMVLTPGSFITYVLFNAKAPGNPDTEHPILAEQRVRRALALALDRSAIAERAFGPGTQTPAAVRSQAWYWVGGGQASGAADTATARRLLAEAGWVDRDGDGIRDRDGSPLELGIIYPVQSSVFAGIAVQLEQAWRRVGVRARLEAIDGAVWIQRRRVGQFDVDIAGAYQDPSPSSLAQSWSCTSAAQPGSSNVGHWCDPEFDRLRTTATTGPDPVAGFRAMFARMASWQPAVVAGAPPGRVAVHTRYENVVLRPSKPWTALWQWRVRPSAMLPRDR
ncbi:MAG: peptide ABC transporter substrate-binding protein [Gemmatimonadales bacterium]